MERVMGIEPTLEAWEAPVLPLNYTRKINHFRAQACSITGAGATSLEGGFSYHLT